MPQQFYERGKGSKDGRVSPGYVWHASGANELQAALGKNVALQKYVASENNPCIREGGGLVVIHHSAGTTTLPRQK